MKLFLCIGLSTLIISTLWGADFPLRKKYPKVPFVTTSDLNKQYASFTIVDVRSKFEYDVIHIKSAKHFALADSNFMSNIKSLKGKIAFYCNGHTCAKSYKAARKAMQAGIKNIFTYDSGIFDWTMKYPARSVLLGESPVNKSNIIPKSELNKRFLDKAEFEKKCLGEKAFLIDGRDHLQKKQTPKFLTKSGAFPFDELVKILGSQRFKSRTRNKTLYIFDAVGKQVRWLQYHLEKHNYKNYYFLKKGVWSIYGSKGAN